MNTLQNEIRKKLLDYFDETQIRNLPIEASIFSSLILYDLFNQKDFNNVFTPYIQYKELDGNKFMDLSLILKESKREEIFKVNIFREEDYHSEVILYTDDTYFDFEYMTEEEIASFEQSYNNSPKYSKELFEMSSNDILLTEESFLNIDLIIKKIATSKNESEFKSYILDNSLENEYLIAKEIFKFPKLEYLDNKNSFIKKDKLEEMRQQIDLSELKLTSSEDFFSAMKNLYKKEYDFLSKNIPYIDNHLNNNTLNFITKKQSTNFSYLKMTKNEVKEVIDNLNFKLGSFSKYLDYSGLGLFRTDFNSLEDYNENQKEVFIVALNDNKELCGIILAKPMSSYEFEKERLYSDFIYNICSVSTNALYRGHNISSNLFEKLIEFCSEENLILHRSMPTTDNQLYIQEKLEKITQKHEESTLIVRHNEKNVFNIFSKVVYDNNLVDVNNKVDKEFIENYKVFIDKLKIESLYPKNEYDSFYLNEELEHFIINSFKQKYKIKNKLKI